MAKTFSGKSWVAWADIHAVNSEDLDDLVEPFRANAKGFIAALEAAGATVAVSATLRPAKRAYLFHYSWLIGLGKLKPKAAKAKLGVDIEWDHGDAAKSKAGALEMIRGFGLAVPPNSLVAPAVDSNHIAGKAIDMSIAWTGELEVAKKDGKTVKVPFVDNANKNTRLHAVGASYGLKKHLTDKPHWSVDGH